MKVKVKMKSLSHIRLFVTPGMAAYKAPLSIGFSRQEYWSGLPFPSPHSRFLLAIYLDRVVCIFQPQSLSLPLPFHLSLLVILSLFAKCVILFLLCFSSSSAAQSCLTPSSCPDCQSAEPCMEINKQSPWFCF